MIDATFTVTAPTPDAGRHPRQPPVPPAGSPGPRRGFTLVEMLTVVVIIGILASLITGAVMRALTRAKITVVAVEINQLEMALKAYKQKHGEYPPDFADIGSDQSKRAVLRHLTKAFPRYVPGATRPNPGTTPWGRLRHDVDPSGDFNIDNLTPASALVFWLGGLPRTGGSTKLIGFSANPRNPFDMSSRSRIAPLFEFDPGRLKIEDGVLTYYPDIGGTRDNAPYVYFRASNRGYDGHPGFVCPPLPHLQWGSTRPCVDTRVPVSTNNPPYDWANPNTFQIRAAGLGGVFGMGREFPAGGDYKDDPETYDDQTNFSQKGTLEDEM